MTRRLFNLAALLVSLLPWRRGESLDDMGPTDAQLDAMANKPFDWVAFDGPNPIVLKNGWVREWRIENCKTRNTHPAGVLTTRTHDATRLGF